MKQLFNIGDTVKHINANWLAIVKDVKYDYAIGLSGFSDPNCKLPRPVKSNTKLFLYTLEDKEKGYEIMGSWGQANLIKP